MDYFVGGVAALLAGNVTPSRPKLAKKARTPTKHQLSPNVTPKSEFVDDRSMFLSPTLQKKKDVLKKSPKRIFQNPELDDANDGEGVLPLTSPKADKVKKHLKSELDSETMGQITLLSPKSPKLNKSKLGNASESLQKKKPNITEPNEVNTQSSNEITPKKKKRDSSSMANEVTSDKENTSDTTTVDSGTTISSKKKRRMSMFIDTSEDITKTESADDNSKGPTIKKKENTLHQTTVVSETTLSSKKKHRMSMYIETGKDNTKIESADENSKGPTKKKKENVSSKTEVNAMDKEALKRKLKNKKTREKKKLKKLLEKQELTNRPDNNNTSLDNNKTKPKKNNKIKAEIVITPDSDQESVENTDSKRDTPKKKKNKPINILSDSKIKSIHTSDAGNEFESENEQLDSNISIKQEKKKVKLHKKQPINEESDSENDSKMVETVKKSKKLRKKRLNQENSDIPDPNSVRDSKKKKPPASDQDSNDSDSNTEQIASPKLTKKKSKVNPNAVTEQNTDSEHESDDEIGSENEQINENIFNTEQIEQNSSSDEEQTEEKGQKKQTKARATEMDDSEIVKRTLFIGNVPFSKKVKKEIKGLFSKYGHIETVRIRTVPVKDGRVTPKLAVIKNELHPDRSTVNVYVKYSDSESVEKALPANNIVLNDYHLRVSRADHSGAADSSRAVFVGNLPFALEDDGLRAVFSKCGDIESVRIVRDKLTNAGKGFGYVNFASKDGVELALSLSEEDLTLKNRIIRVKRCAQKNSPQGRPRFQGNHRDARGNKRGDFQRGFGYVNFASKDGVELALSLSEEDLTLKNRIIRVKRCAQKNSPQGRPRFQGNHRDARGNKRGDFQRDRNQGGNSQRRNQDGNNNQGRPGGFHGRIQGGFQPRNQGGFHGNRNYQEGGYQPRNKGNFHANQGGNDGFKGKRSQGDRQRQDGPEDGAHRRIMKKRQHQESGEGPPPKVPKGAPDVVREKKPRKEYVGITADKKKKHKFNKGDKKKKALSKILMKT